jgi:multidrug efflux pump subunit AcrB
VNRVIDWFVDHPVASNLLMALVVVSGFVSLSTIRQDLFPEVNPGLISISVAYPGAGPEEIEKGVVIRVEEAVQDIEGVKRVTSTSVENAGSVMIELETGVRAKEVIDHVKTRVDAIDTFPEHAEKPVIQEIEMRMHVVNVAVSGDADEGSLKRVAERVRDEIAALRDVSLVSIANARPYEVSIEVSEAALRRHGLTFDEVAAAIRRASVELPGGSVKTRGGEILLRTDTKAARGAEFEELPIQTRPDGSRLLLGDVARVVDGFRESDQWTRFDGRPALILQVFRTGEQGVLGVADAVNDYVAKAQGRMPEGVSLATYWDNSVIFRGRIDLLLRNGRLGLLLVFLVLVLFFRLRMAFFVAIGLPVAFLGAIWVMPALDVSINLMSLFSFIVVLGILVDDSIVVSENIYRHNQLGREGREAAKIGTKEVLLPVLLAVGTTVAAFIPMLTLPGMMGDFASVIPKVVILCLAFSLVEALLILPHHLRRLRTRQPPRGTSLRAWAALQDAFAGWLKAFILRVYRPALKVAIRWRYATLSFAAATLLLTVGLFAGGWAKFSFFPPIEGDYVVALVRMPLGIPASETDRVVRELERTALGLVREIEGDLPGSVVRHVITSVGTQPFKAAQNRGPGESFAAPSGSHLGEVVIELLPSERRDVSTAFVVDRWRERVPALPDAQELTFNANIMSSGKPIDLRLSSPDLEDLERAAVRLKAKLAEYPGVLDIADSFLAGKKELRIRVRPEAEALGLSDADLARQVRQGYYGEEAQRFLRNREDVKVMVRYPADERASLADIENMRVRLPRGGVEVPFRTVAAVEFGRGPAAIQRTDRQRSIHVTAEVDLTKGTPNEILTDLGEGFLPLLDAEHPGLSISFEGEQRQQSETMGGVWRGMAIALLLIYALLAIGFRSYLQPLLVMAAIPFGVAGALWAHFFLGMHVTMMSLIGVLALSGVVVNDSLILIDFVNRCRAEGMRATRAVLASGPVRFRPILITTLTTFAGLTPMLLEKSVQAQFLIPMAVSLAYGLLFATGIILVIIPVLYMALEDLRAGTITSPVHPPGAPASPKAPTP